MQCSDEIDVARLAAGLGVSLKGKVREGFDDRVRLIWTQTMN